MNENEVLTEANRLVSSGLRHAAIDLLQESLHSYPSSPALLSALGRVYLLSGQPENAVVYLKRSLESSQARKALPQSLPSGQTDDFTEDDLQFIDAQAEKHCETDFSPYEFNDSEPRRDTATGKSDQPKRPILHITQGNKNRRMEGRDEQGVKIEYRNRRRITSQGDSSRLVRKVYREHLDKGNPPTESPSLEFAPNPRRESNNLPTSPTQRSSVSKPESLDSLRQDTTLPSSANLSLKQIDILGHGSDSEPVNQPSDEILTPNCELDFDFDEIESDDEDADSLIELVPPILDDEETDELAWDDYDDLDEFDEQAQREDIEHSRTDGAISREMRARQIAVEVLAKCDWHPSSINLLQQVFVENSWGLARVAIEREIEKGLLPEELALARAIRKHWFDNERYWITFARIKKNGLHMQADAVYRQMSWAEALRIVRCFPSLPAVDEVLYLIEETYEWWYSNQNLCRNFKTFFKFLKYRTGSMRGALPGHCVFSFLEWPESDVGVDSIGVPHYNTPTNQYLQELGIQLPIGEPLPKNIMRIREESEE